jgi:apolipoprotein N-acyltransferase
LTGRARAALGGAAALALFAAFPHPVAGRVVDGGFVLAWIAPALALAALRGLPPRRAALAGFAIWWVAYSAILHWIYVVTVTYGHAHPAVGVLAPLVLALYIAAFGAAFAAGHAWLTARGRSPVFAAALSWTALDHARSFVFTGFPWATLGYAQHESDALLGLASYTGVYGLSFVSVLGGAALLETAWAWREGRRPPHAVIAALGVVVVGYGLGTMAPRAAGPEQVRIGVVQGNVDQGVKWNAAWIERTLSRYEALSRQAVAAGAQLVVWPETAVPGALEAEPRLRARLATLARETGAAYVVGGVGIAFDANGRPAAYYDSAYHFDATGALRDRYDKTHLVPFGEYIPFQDLLGRFLSAVARGIARVGVEPGPAPRAVAVALPDGREVRIGVAICYELLFPDLVRRFAADGGSVLLGITNDAWYGRTGAPYQFLAITALRAAETGLSVARAANTGVSAFIDGEGEVREATPLFESAFRVADVPLHPAPREATFYVRHGDVFAWTCWALCLLEAAIAFARARGAAMRNDPRP